MRGLAAQQNRETLDGSTGMDQIAAISEDEFVASFLAGEINSVRFGDGLLELTRQKGWPVSLVTDPRLDDAEDCERRRDLLALHRGFGMDRELFEGFPNDVVGPVVYHAI